VQSDFVEDDDMDALWLIGSPAQCYRVPEQQLIVNKQGELVDLAAAYRESINSAEDFSRLCAQAELLVVVAGAALKPAGWLELIPCHIPKVGLLIDNSNADAREQLGKIGIDAYVSSAMSQADYELVLHKVHDDKLALNALQQELKSFSAIAFIAMSSASEMGTVALFAEKVQEAMELERLAQLIHGCLGDLNLNGVMQFVFDDGANLFPANTSASYVRLLNLACESSARIVSHGRFLLFSFEHLQLLVIDAPVNDEERYGRLRDVLAHMVSIAEARAKTLKVNTLLKIQQENTRTVMMLLEMSSRDNRNAVKEIMTELSDSLRMIATGFDLNMQQESALLGLSEKALVSLESLQETTTVIEDHFRSLIQELDNVSHLLDSSEVIVDEAHEQDSRVELF
jgi:hypothetical protein